MVEQDMPADWAIERACELTSGATQYAAAIKRNPQVYTTSIAFARYIEAHEEAPVDPLLIEARELVAQNANDAGDPYWAEEARAGEHDTSRSVRVVLAALRRGMELAKEQANG